MRITSLGHASGVAVPGVREVALLGDGKPLAFRRTDDALEVELPDGAPASALGLALRITLARPEPKPRSRWLHN